MPACPAGHDSAATDFCDICGMRIGGTSAAASAAPAAGGEEPAAPSGEPCPRCGTGRNGQFCEVCGFDFAAGRPAKTAQPAQPAQPGETAQIGETPQTAQTAQTAPTWTAVVTVDRGYFDTVLAAEGPDSASLRFPAYCPERRFALTGPQMRIGRRSASRGLEPEIDLAGPPVDPGVSHLHAVLIAQADGTWSVLDPGSANGTKVNGADIAEGVPVPLSAGDRVCLGAWTVLTIEPVQPG